ncbi:hypothetical protein AAC387_Pa06g0445 [Persea americana]
MERKYLDLVLVPMGLALMLGYHVWLCYRIVKHPTKTLIGTNSISRWIWVRTMMEDSPRNGILAVQTFRNNIMASTLMASTAIMLSSVISVLMVTGSGVEGRVFVYGDTSKLGLSIKFFSILACLLVAFLMNVLSIRYYSHASILINVPPKDNKPNLTIDYVGRTVNRGSYFWSLGLRAFYFSFPLFLWVFGPIPMFLCCLVLVFLLSFIDESFDCAVRSYEGDEEEGMKTALRA